MKLAALTHYALSLAQAIEQPHFQYASYRVGGKIFMTVAPEGTHVHVFVGETQREPALALHPGCVEKLLWGGKVVGLRIALAKVPPQVAKDLVRAAWEQRVPARKPAGRTRR